METFRAARQIAEILIMLAGCAVCIVLVTAIYIWLRGLFGDTR